jgi:hypothetical protein
MSDLEKQLAGMMIFLHLFIERVREILPTARVDFALPSDPFDPFDEKEGYADVAAYLLTCFVTGPDAAACHFRVGDFRLNLEFCPSGLVTVYRHRPGFRAEPDFFLDPQAAIFVAAVFDEFIQGGSEASYERRGPDGALGLAGHLMFGPQASG